MRHQLLFAALAPALLLAPARANVPFLWGVTGTAGASSSLYVIRPSTGAATLVGSTGRTNVSGLSIHPANGTLYATQGQMGGTKSLLILNKTTGAATTIGDLGEAVADTAFSPAGVLYLYGAQSKQLQTANLGTAAKALVKDAAAEIGGCGITFGNDGKLYLNRSTVIRELNPANGNQINQAVLSGATTDIDNLLVTLSTGEILGGQRNNKAAPTRLFTVNPTTGATVLLGSVPLSLSGLASDIAAKPKLTLKGPSTVRIRKLRHLLKGTYQSKIPGRIVAPKNSVSVKPGPWKLPLTKLKVGTNRIRLVCTDVLGQRTTRIVKVVVSK